MQRRNIHQKKGRFEKITVSQKIKNSEKILGISLIAIIGLVSVFYMSKTVSITTNGYDVKGYEKQLDELKRENQKMIIELADLKAIHNLESETNMLVAVKNNNIRYITSTSTLVAMEK